MTGPANLSLLLLTVSSRSAYVRSVGPNRLILSGPGAPHEARESISWLEEEAAADERTSPAVDAIRERLEARDCGHGIVVGFTGTGGAGKSSVVDELVRRFQLDFP